MRSEKRLIPTPSPFKSTAKAKRQVQIIRLLQALRRQYYHQKSTTNTINQLSQLEVYYNLTPASIPTLIAEERQHPRQIQNDIDIHREEHLINQSQEARKAAQQAANDNLKNSHKERATILSNIRRREKQARA